MDEVRRMGHKRRQEVKEQGEAELGRLVSRKQKKLTLKTPCNKAISIYRSVERQQLKREEE